GRFHHRVKLHKRVRGRVQNMVSAAAGFSGSQIAGQARRASSPLQTGVAYTIDAVLSPTEPQVIGTAEIQFTNTASVAVDDMVLVLFPNRFSQPDKGVNDF